MNFRIISISSLSSIFPFVQASTTSAPFLSSSGDVYVGCVTKEFHDLRLLELNGDPSSLNEFGGLYSMHSDATQSNEIKASLLVYIR